MITPLKHRILVQLDKPPAETVGGLYIPDSAQKKQSVGVVLAVGPEADEVLQVGQKVAFGQHDGFDVSAEYCDGAERCVMLADTHVRYIIGDNS